MDKRCSKCHKILSYSDFHKNKSMKDGYCNQCKTCSYIKSQKYYKNNKEKVLKKCQHYRNKYSNKVKKYHQQRYLQNKCQIDENNRKYYYENQNKVSQRRKVYYRKNRKAILKQCTDYYSNNKITIRQKHKDYYENNKDKYIKYVLKRKKLLNTLLSDLYNAEIKEVYSNCPEGYHVDHIIPLMHNKICGLHVPWNLQYLTAEENLKKHNKFDNTISNNSWRLSNEL